MFKKEAIFNMLLPLGVLVIGVVFALLYPLLHGPQHPVRPHQVPLTANWVGWNSPIAPDTMLSPYGSSRTRLG